MEIVTGLFIVGLYKATEKIWEKEFDAAWTLVSEALEGALHPLGGERQGEPAGGCLSRSRRPHHRLV